MSAIKSVPVLPEQRGNQVLRSTVLNEVDIILKPDDGKSG